LFFYIFFGGLCSSKAGDQKMASKMTHVDVEFEYSAYDPGDAARGVLRIKAGDSSETSPREIAIVVDVSGSMTPVLHTVRTVCEFALSRFANRGVACALVSFADDAKVHHPMVPVDDDIVSRFTASINTFATEGQTNLYGGISAAYELFSPNASKSLIVITDGVPNVGALTREEMRLRQGFSVYTVAIGDSCDHALLAALANETGGMYADARALDDVVSATGGLFGAIFGTVLTDVSLCMNANSLSMLPCKKTAFATTVNVGSLFANEDVYIPFQVDSKQVRFFTAQVYAAGELVKTIEAQIPISSAAGAFADSQVKTQLLRGEISCFLHTDPIDAAWGSVLLAKCADDRSPVGLWMSKRLGAFMQGSIDSLPTLQQELVRARSTAYHDAGDLLVPSCMRAFSQEASEFASTMSLDLGDDEPVPRPVLRREHTSR
jgi:Mg-chelatase subunit ChlD